METINFTEKNFINVNVIDNQHFQLAEVTNMLYSSMSNSEDILLNLDKLIEILELHFATEEKLMKENRFPGYFSHKLEHDRFYNQIIQITDKIKTGKSELTIDNLESIKRWFFNHIEMKDIKCGEFLNSIGIS